MSGTALRRSGDLATTSRAPLLRKAGVTSAARRWKQRPNPNGKNEPWRGYDVACIREAARRWKVRKSVGGALASPCPHWGVTRVTRVTPSPG